MVDLLLDQEMVRTGQPVVAYNQSMLLGISRLWPVKLEGVHSLFPVEAVVTSETSNTYYYPSGTLDVEIAVLKNPKLARKVFHIEGGRESEELELLDWNEPLFLGDMCDEFIDVTLAKAEVAEEESDLAHLMECWDKDNRYCGESDKMNIVMSKEQALSCLGVYDGLIEERMGWYDSFYGDDEDLSVTAFCSRLMSSTQIDAGLVIKSSDEDIARNATGERLECESFITYLHSINHPCLRQPDKPMSLNLEVQIKCGLLHITEAKVLEEKEEK